MEELVPKNLEKGLVAAVVGSVAAVVVVISLEPSLRGLYPLPATDSQASERFGQLVGSLPFTTLLLLLGFFAIVSLIGGMVSSLAFGGTRSWPALVTGLVLMIAGTYGVMSVYHPLWFRLASFLPYSMAYVGHLLIRRVATRPT